MASRFLLMAAIIGLVLNETKSGLIQPREEDFENNPYNATFQSILPEERKYFIAYNLALAIEQFDNSNYSIAKEYNIPEELIDKFKGISMPSDFPQQMKDWIVNVWNIPEKYVKKLASGTCYCYTPYNCVDLDDNGCCCCFFSSLPPDFKPTKKRYSSCY